MDLCKAAFTDQLTTIQTVPPSTFNAPTLEKCLLQLLNTPLVSTIFTRAIKKYARRGARTHDPGIKSPMLYRLS
ncbi:hypothetical protein T06_8829 [Trichinella sp. T6]|nr:hypothetical protein T06_8829 [Trichinella sp. T6]